MLEIKNLTKIYKNKVGTDVKALDDVSLKFPETGMVFLLGKSGSGKSTLLNVCGGLDNPTSGEIIVKGRSSNDFNQADFDSYRNTFVGFIFQEYNILNEFSVYDNIALAIELQDKTPDKKVIEDLLKKVDLDGYAKRKPNTLSGGQKQRIAIARALVKNPEIIMADEPTGALDSTTGKQVLDTLKKLSEDTLVIVVSHDREFAETYGDRIIELKDGKILSDISKTQEHQTELSKNVSVIGDTLSIKSGSNLTETDFESIKKFIKSSSNDVVLSKNDKDITALKKSARITDDGEMEVFKDTDYQSIEIKKYSKKDSEFIRSKLPLRHAFKIGVSSMKNKPFRLFMTVILVSVAFMLFGLLSTMTFYDNESTFKDTLLKSGYEYLKVGKMYKQHVVDYANGEKTFDYDTYYDTPLAMEDYEALKNKYGKDVFYGADVTLSFSTQKNNKYYNSSIFTIAYMESDNKLYDTIVGAYPKNENEILISSYTVDSMINNVAYDADNDAINIHNRDEIIGKEVKFNNKSYKVVGYFESGEVDPKYDTLKDNSTNLQLETAYANYLMDELHLVAFFVEDEVARVYDEMGGMWIDDITNYTVLTVKSEFDDDFSQYSSNTYDKYSSKYGDVIKLNNQGLTGNNVYISMREYAWLVADAEYDRCNLTGYCDSELINLAYKVADKGEHTEDGFKSISDEEQMKLLNQLLQKNNKATYKLSMRFFDDYTQSSYGENINVTVVGIYTDALDNGRDIILLSDDLYNDLWNEQKTHLDYYSITSSKYEIVNTAISTVYVPYDHSEEATNDFYSIYNDKDYGDDDSRLILSSIVVSDVEMIDNMVDTLYKVFLYGGIVLCVFAILLFSNFISVSISNKTREIGILRAVGARSSDVFKIFFSESFVITTICLTLSIIGTVVVCNILNSTISYGVGVSIFVFGIFSFLVLVLIGILAAFLATYLPVLKAAKKKPVESIRSI